MRTYPIMLDVRGRRAVVVGGGPVGLRKAQALAAAGADVTLVAERLSSPRAPDGVAVLRAAYRPGVLAGAVLVLACTDDAALNARIAADARAAGALANAADQPEACDFFAPAVLRDGDVVVAVGTGGAAPALAKHLRDRLAAAMPQRVGQFAALLEALRGEVQASPADPARRGEVLRRLADDETYAAFLAGGAEAVRGRLERLLRGPADRPR